MPSRACSHTLTGVWVEIWMAEGYCEVGTVTPSRVCEFKFLIHDEDDTYSGHTLTGVWVEILLTESVLLQRSCHTLTGVWVEICILRHVSPGVQPSHPHGCVSWNGKFCYLFFQIVKSHPHGCVSWNSFRVVCLRQTNLVTPSRVCELKSWAGDHWTHGQKSHPHGCVSWNMSDNPSLSAEKVTPSRVCELKWYVRQRRKRMSGLSHPHGCVSWNLLQFRKNNVCLRSHPHGCVSWNFHDVPDTALVRKSHPHGCVSWNCEGSVLEDKKIESHPHGCVSWNNDVFTVINGEVVTPSRVCELKS